MRGNERLLAILSALGERPCLSLSEISESVGLPKSTALRFLRSLEAPGWVVRSEEGGYALGPAVVALAGRYLSHDALVAVSAVPMRELRDALGETISLSRLAGRSRVCIQEFPSLQNLRLVLGVGERGPLHAGASGLLLLASLPPLERREILAEGLPSYTPATLTSPARVERECDLIARQGWALTRGTRTAGGLAIAVPVRHPGAPDDIAALGAFGPELRCATKREQRRWLDALLDCAATIEASLHASPAPAPAPAPAAAAAAAAGAVTPQGS